MEKRVHSRDAGPTPNSDTGFDYGAAFSRNIGWITEWEQQELRKKTVAIAGLGGVGGAHAVILARLGVGGFHIADLDRFDVPNFNRQTGAFVSTLGLEKTAVTAHMIRDINPELRLKIFDRGVDDENLDEFLSGVDLFVDGFDFFVLGIRRRVFRRCAELGIPAITAAPIGFGTSYLIFMPGGMTFEQYFRFEGLSEDRQYVNFALGLAPAGLHRPYIADPSRLDFAERRVPSSAAAIQLCAGIVGAESVKILLGRGNIDAAPAFHQFDGYRGKWKRGVLPNGNAGPLQSLKRHLGYKAFASLSRKSRPSEAPAGSEIERILDLARWAPSGDNHQPWRFEILDEDRIGIAIAPETDNIYDYNNGQPTLLASGMLLESMRIAASRFGRAAEWGELEPQGRGYRLEVRLTRNPSVAGNPLGPYIAIRSVNRRPYRTTRLSAEQKNTLELAAGGEFEIHWYESPLERWRAARLNARATDVRLRLRAAYEVHRRIVDWEHRFSRDGVPAAAIGLDGLTLGLMRWAMADWNRVNFVNRLFGTGLAQFELDLLPGLLCGGHFAIQRRAAPAPGGELASLLRAGQAVQRFWLTATALGLSMQPAIAPLILASYAAGGEHFRDLPAIDRKARAIAGKLAQIEGFEPGLAFFRGRLGWPVRLNVGARSIRKPLKSLLEGGGRPLSR